MPAGAQPNQWSTSAIETATAERPAEEAPAGPALGPDVAGDRSPFRVSASTGLPAPGPASSGGGAGIGVASRRSARELSDMRRACSGHVIGAFPAGFRLASKEASGWVRSSGSNRGKRRSSKDAPMGRAVTPSACAGRRLRRSGLSQRPSLGPEDAPCRQEQGSEAEQRGDRRHEGNDATQGEGDDAGHCGQVRVT